MSFKKLYLLGLVVFAVNMYGAPPVATNGAASVTVGNTISDGQVAATDSDTNLDANGYALVDDASEGSLTFNTDGSFTYNPASDFVDLGAGQTRSVTFTFTASDDANEVSSPATITITVTGIDDPATFSNNSSITVDENQTATLTVSATDPDSNQTVDGYSLAAGNDGSFFSITSAGVLTFDNAPDFDNPQDAGANNTYTVVVQALDGSTVVGTQTITVNVRNVNEPATFSNSGTVNVNENQTAVVTVQATDEDTGDTVVGYRFATAGTHNNDLFSIVSATGILTFDDAPDFETPQGGTGSSNAYTVIVEALNSSNAVLGTQTITVNVQNVNEPTVFSNDASTDFEENSLDTVLEVAATDPDGAVTGYSVTGVDGSLFSITPAGILTFLATPNFETPLGGASDNSNVYTITVNALNGINVLGSQDVTITVTDLEAEEAVFSNSASVNVAENVLDVVTVVAVDDDTDDTVTTYRFATTGAHNNDLFTIDADSGEITFIGEPDFETPLGGVDDDSNSYTIIVEALDDDGTSVLGTQTITVNVQDADEDAVFSATLGESDDVADFDAVDFAEEGIGPVLEIAVEDLDADDTVASYTITGVNGSLFAITSAGTLTFVDRPDFETPLGGADDDSNDYTLTVNALDSDGNTLGSQAITITVTDLENEPAVFTSSDAVDVAENRTDTILEIVANDLDDTDIITDYSVTGTDGNFFNISSGGELTFKSGPNFELALDEDQDNAYVLIVNALDTNGNILGSQAITITVTEGNDPAFFSVISIEVDENQTEVLTVVAVDEDPAHIVTTYRLATVANSNNNDLFTITAEGVITFNSAPDFETPLGGVDDDSNSYIVTVEALDDDGIFGNRNARDNSQCTRCC